MLVVGLTGDMASGKSVASKTLRDLGLPIIDADLIAREMVKPNEAGYRDIVDHFGKGILNPDQTINRRKLAKIIFSDSKEREGLNSLLHPRIVKKIKRKIEDFKGKGKRMVIVDAALLIEAGELSLVDKLIVVIVSKRLQIKRLAQRDHLTEKEARERIATQMPLSEKMKLADYVVNNSGPVRKTVKRVKEVYHKLQLTIVSKEG